MKNFQILVKLQEKELFYEPSSNFVSTNHFYFLVKIFLYRGSKKKEKICVIIYIKKKHCSKNRFNNHLNLTNPIEKSFLK